MILPIAVSAGAPKTQSYSSRHPGGTGGRFDDLQELQISNQEVRFLTSPSPCPVRVRPIALVGCAVAAVVGLLPSAATASGSRDTYQDAASGVHAPAVAALKASGILKGTNCGPDMFCPNAPFQRNVMVVWIARAVDRQEPARTVATASFKDVDNRAWWAPHVDRIARLRVTLGCSTTPPL